MVTAGRQRVNEWGLA